MCVCVEYLRQQKPKNDEEESYMYGTIYMHNKCTRMILLNLQQLS